MEGFANLHEEVHYVLQNHDTQAVQIREQFECDDPQLKKLTINCGDGFVDGEYFPVNYGWERDGESIGNNTHIQELTLLRMNDEDDKLEEDIITFLRGVSSNTSIKTMRFSSDFELVKGTYFIELIPFFQANRNFTRLDIQDCTLRGGGVKLIASALGKFVSLTHFTFKMNGTSGDGVGKLIAALRGHSNLRSLVLHDNNIRSRECGTLANLLQNPESKLSNLSLNNNGIDNRGLVALVSGMSNNSTLSSLNLQHNRKITETGWRVFFDGVAQSQICRLQQLNLKDNNIDDNSIHYLVDTLRNNTQLKMLSLQNNIHVSAEGWQTFSTALQHDGSRLESLCLSANCIENDSIVSFANALRYNVHLKELDLECNHDVTDMGWEAFFSILDNSRSALERLYLHGNYITDDVVFALASWVNKNRTLKEVTIDGHRSTISSNGWAEITRILCIKSSIMCTFRSNHVLEKVSRQNQRLPRNLICLLQINAANSEREARRLKITKTHFPEGFTVYPFVDMELNVLPSAIAWIGRSGIDGGVDARHYQYVKSMPLLFDSKGLRMYSG